MGLNFPGSGANYVNIGDVAGARFDANLSWSWLAFFRVGTYTGSDKTICAKGEGVPDRQFQVVIAAGTDPADLEYYNDNNMPRITLSSAVTGAGWFMVAVTSNGAADATSITMRLFGPDRVQDASGTGQGSDPGTQTEPIRIGVKDTSTDPLDGDVDLVAYFAGVEFSQDLCAAYAGNPYAVLRAYSTECEFFMKLGATGADVVDLSGADLGSITGTLTLTDSPPVAPFSMGQIQPVYPPPSSAPQAIVVPATVPVIYHHRQRNF